MESEGPYHIKRMPLGGIGIIGPNRTCEEISYSGMSEDQAKQCVNFLNEGYAEGRKAAEKDLKELLEFSDRMSKWARDLSGKELVYRFQHWKRSHGFVDENSEKEMRELWHILHD